MRLSKRLLKHPIVQAALAWLLSLYIRLVYVTSRKQYDYHAAALPYMQGKANGIFAFWHGRMMLCPTICPPHHTMHILISLHRDGMLISSVIGHFGQKTISGSSSKGGKEAAIGILRALENGDNIGITPDGPRGPAQVAAMGVASIARLSGKPVIPVTFSSTRAKRFNSWDRFMLALPFGRVVFCTGAPIMIGEEANEEEARMQIEKAMNLLIEKADGMTHG